MMEATDIERLGGLKNSAQQKKKKKRKWIVAPVCKSSLEVSKRMCSHGASEAQMFPNTAPKRGSKCPGHVTMTKRGLGAIHHSFSSWRTWYWAV